MPAPIVKPASVSLSGAIRGAAQGGGTPPRGLLKAQALREAIPPGTGNPLLAMAGAPPAQAPGGMQPPNVLAGAGQLPNPLVGPPSASPGPVNALTAAAGGPAPAPAPMPPQGISAPQPAQQPSPNPQIAEMAQRAAAANLSPADLEAAKARASFVMHNLAPLVRQPGEITPGDLLKVTSQGVKRGLIPPAQAQAFVAGLPTDQAGIRQALNDRVQAAIAASVHLAGAIPAPGSPQQPAPNGSN